MSEAASFMFDSPVLLLASVAVAVGISSFLLKLRTPPPKPLPSGTVSPPRVRSLLPYLGSAIEMGAGIKEYIRKYSKKFDGAPVFTATVLGDTCVFIADPEYLTWIFKSSYQKKLDSLSLQKQFVTNVLDISATDTGETVFTENVYKTVDSQYQRYLFKGEELNRSIGKVQEFFVDLIPQLASSKEWEKISLFSMVKDAIFKASVGPLISYHVANDEALQAFQDFDKGVIALFNSVPQFLLQKPVKARAKLMEQLLSPDFYKKGSPLMNARRESLDLPEAVLSKGNLGLLWGSVGNSMPAVFWMLLRLMENETAWLACRAQVDEVVASRKTDVFTLDDLDQLTLLQSAFTEVLRLYQGNFTARRVVEDFVFEANNKKYLIRSGSKLMSFWGVLHSDPDVFENPEEFQYDRFVDTNKKYAFKSGRKLTHAPVMAFGGGTHLCPGRKFISYETRLFLAMLMYNFDMRLVKGEPPVGIDLTTQGIAVSQPDRDPKVEIRLRCR